MLMPNADPFFKEASYAVEMYFNNIQEFSEFVISGLENGGVLSLGLPVYVTTLWGITYEAEIRPVKNVFMSDSDDRFNGNI